MLALSHAQLKEWDRAIREAETLKKSDRDRGESLLKYIKAQR